MSSRSARSKGRVRGPLPRRLRAARGTRSPRHPNTVGAAFSRTAVGAWSRFCEVRRGLTGCCCLHRLLTSGLVMRRPHRCVHHVSRLGALVRPVRGAAPNVMLGALVASALALPATANPPSSISAKRAEAQQVLTQINGLNASLSRADERLNLANLRLAKVQSAIKTNNRELRIAKRNLIRGR